jgi:hypothetical protein
LTLFKHDKCVVFGTLNENIAEGILEEHSSGYMKVRANGSFELSEGQFVKISVFNGYKGECIYSAAVKKIRGHDIVFDDVEFEGSFQKRDNARVEKIMPYRFTHRAGEAGEKIQLEKPAKITILNISARGMYFTSNEEYEEGYRFYLLFKETQTPIELLVEIVRAEESFLNYNFGCRFVDITEEEMEEIFRFVLNEQIEQRRKRLERLIK